MEILTSQQMRRIDRRAIRRFGVPESVLMENAGLRVFEWLQRPEFELRQRKALILAGPGNNGGDAFVVARHLHNHRIPFDIVLFGRRREVRGPAGANLRALDKVGVAPREITTRAAWRAVRPLLDAADLVIDGLLGTGLSRPLQGLLATVVEDVNAARALVVAVDIPSGLSGDSAEIPGPCVRADHTITFVRPKIPHVFPPAETMCGRIQVTDIGVPREAVAAEEVDLDLLQPEELATLLPRRRADSHKGDYGHALVIAGSRGKGGAARMASLGALRAGCGLVTAAVPRGLQSGFVSRAMEIMTEGLPETAEGTIAAAALEPLLSLLEGKQALAIGPGLTTHPETVTVVREVVKRARVPVVLDADGINAFADDVTALDGRSRPIALTPHPGEMGRLVGLSSRQVQARRLPLARGFAVERRCHLILKGHRTLVADPAGRVSVNPTGNPGMAKGGSGDVLTGLLVGLLAQGIDAADATRLAVYLHGLAGDLAAAEIGETPLIARDILHHFPAALQRLKPPRIHERADARGARRTG